MDRIIKVLNLKTSQEFTKGLQLYFKNSIGSILDLSIDELGQNTAEFRESDLIILDTLDTSKSIDLVKKITAPIIILFESSKKSHGIDIIKETFMHKDNVLSIIDLDIDFEFHIPLLRTIINSYQRENDIRKLETISSKLEEVVNETTQELVKIKKIHEKLVPVKNEKIKSLKIVSKYAPGEKPGGDFFDVIKKENEILLFLSTSPSYLVSSVILTHFSYLNEYDSFTKDILVEFGKNLLDELPVILDGMEDGVDFTIMKINLKNLDVEGINIGRGRQISNRNAFVPQSGQITKNNIIDGYFNYKLDRGEKLLVLSSGMSKNTNDILNGDNSIKFLKGMFNLAPKEALNEIFYHVKKDIKGSFLKFDTSVIYIEVDKNAIVQI